MRSLKTMDLHRTRTISVASGKGGVGKTTIIANLALALTQKGKKVLVLDGDLGMANVDIFFGIKPNGNIHDIISGKKEMREILKEVSQNLFLIPGGNGIVEFNHLNFFERRAIIEGISALPGRFDYLLIDTAPGISENVLFLNSSVQTVSVVITPDPSSFADAYALIKVLTTKHKVQRFSIICNMVRDHEEGHALFKKFSEVVTKFLFVGLEYWGGIPMDAALRKANQSQRLILKHEPMAESASAIRKISDQVDLTSRHINSSGGMQMFWDQVVGSA